MEKQMRAERDRRAAILTAEGEKQAQILTAEGAKQAAVLTAEGERQAAILRAEGEAKAIDTVFKAIHEGKPDRELLSYEYLQMLPELAEGDANKVFVIPSEFAEAFGGIGEALRGRVDRPPPPGRRPRTRPEAAPRLSPARPRAATPARISADVRLARREAPGNARRCPPARNADRAGRRRARCARSASRCSRRTSTSRSCGSSPPQLKERCLGAERDRASSTRASRS